MRPRRAPLLALGLSLITLLALGGCASTGAMHAQESLPTEGDLAALLKTPASASATAAALPAQDWWSAYHDANLSHWIALGLASSPTVREARARLEQAQAIFAITRAAELPSLGASADSTAQRVSGTGIYPPPLAGMVHTVNDVDLSATFELDLFGRLAARTEQARLDARASAVNVESVRIGLAGAIGHAYFDLARAQQQLRIAQELEASRTKTLELVRDRVRAGLDTRVERELAQVTVPEIRVDIERAQEQIALARHALAVLAGQEPHAADTLVASLPDDKYLAQPTQMPLDWVARRADVTAARQRALAAASGIRAARADFYPNINLGAVVGLNSLTTQTLFEYNSRVWQIGPAIHLPIFSGGSLRAQLGSANAASDAAIDAYEATVLKAAGEVADAVSSVTALDRQREQQREATAHAQAAADLAQIRYQAGLGNYLTVLTAQTSVLAQRRTQLELDARAAAMDVTLALALGGGFRGEMVP